jgi:hypothetical protein
MDVVQSGHDFFEQLFQSLTRRLGIDQVLAGGLFGYVATLQQALSFLPEVVQFFL